VIFSDGEGSRLPVNRTARRREDEPLGAGADRTLEKQERCLDVRMDVVYPLVLGGLWHRGAGQVHDDINAGERALNDVAFGEISGHDVDPRVAFRPLIARRLKAGESADAVSGREKFLHDVCSQEAASPCYQNRIHGNLRKADKRRSSRRSKIG